MSEVNPIVLVRRRSGSPATRRRIADAALVLFSTRGYAATSLQAIADAAGLHVQTIYQTYGSKPGGARGGVRTGARRRRRPGDVTH